MRRKHNPIVSLVALVLLVLLLATTAGCAAPAETAENGASNSTRFDVESCSGNLRIITDTETGAQYLLYASSCGACMTVLQDGEG